jgi:two-component system, OmpR family, phosphate regulon sensor histidine kinase PhoR
VSIPEFANSELEALTARLARGDRSDPLVEELLTGLQTTIEELRVAGEELSRQNEELLTLHDAVAAEAQRFRQLFELAPIAYIATDSGGTILDANAAAAALLGTEQRFLTGKPLPIFIDLKRRRAFRQSLLGASRSAQPTEVLIQMRRKTGVAFDAAARIVAVGDQLLWAIADETLLRQADERVWELNRELEERVAEQRAELETLIDELPIGVAVITRYGLVDRRNKRAGELLDDDDDDDDDDWARSIRTLDGEHLEPDQLPGARAIAGQVVRDELFQIVRRDGSSTTIELSAVPLRRGALVVLSDVSARERRERSEREFVTNAAHQIRTPITAIATAAAAMRAGAGDDPAQREVFLRHVELAIERLTNLTEALLTLARVERGEAAQRGIVPLRAVLDRAAGRNPNVRIHCERGSAAIADERLLVEAVSNVVDNAEKHGGGGPIDVTAGVVESTARIEIRDRGPGIPADQREDVLQRFHGAGKGSGLGLAIAREALRALDGRLTLSDAAGGGLAVTFELPGARIL